MQNISQEEKFHMVSKTCYSAWMSRTVGALDDLVPWCEASRRKGQFSNEAPLMVSSWIPCPEGFRPCALPWASLGCGTLIIADKWKTPPTSNGVICFPAPTQKWQQKKCTLRSTEFHYSAANLLELNPHRLAMLHLQAPVQYVHLYTHVFVRVRHVHACFVFMWVCMHGFTVCERVQILPLSVKTRPGSCSRRSFSKDLHSK